MWSSDFMLCRSLAVCLRAKPSVFWSDKSQSQGWRSTWQGCYKCDKQGCLMHNRYSVMCKSQGRFTCGEQARRLSLGTVRVMTAVPDWVRKAVVIRNRARCPGQQSDTRMTILRMINRGSQQRSNDASYVRKSRPWK